MSTTTKINAAVVSKKSLLSMVDYEACWNHYKDVIQLTARIAGRQGKNTNGAITVLNQLNTIEEMYTTPLANFGG